MEWFDKVLGWLKTTVPWTIAVAIWQYLTRKLWKAERTIEQKELEIEHFRNKETVEKLNHNRSNADIVMDAVREGKELSGEEGGDSDS